MTGITGVILLRVIRQIVADRLARDMHKTRDTNVEQAEAASRLVAGNQLLRYSGDLNEYVPHVIDMIGTNLVEFRQSSACPAGLEG